MTLIVLLKLPIVTFTFAVRLVAASLAAALIVNPSLVMLVIVSQLSSLLSTVQADDDFTVTSLVLAAQGMLTLDTEVVRKSNGSIISSSMSISRVSFTTVTVASIVKFAPVSEPDSSLGFGFSL